MSDIGGNPQLRRGGRVRGLVECRAGRRENVDGVDLEGKMGKKDICFWFSEVRSAPARYSGNF